MSSTNFGSLCSESVSERSKPKESPKPELREFIALRKVTDTRTLDEKDDG